MNLDEIIKYLLWIALFGIAIGAIYVLFKNLGVMQ